MNKKLSIVIPIYNNSEYMKKLMDELLKQVSSYNDIEIIVVDDGSTEDMSFLDEMPIIVKHLDNNTGVQHARNICLSLASGEYTVWLDSDDFIMPTYIEEIYNLISSDNLDFYTLKWYMNDMDTLGAQHEYPLINWAVWGYCFKTSCIKKYKFDESYNAGGDYEWLVRAIKNNINSLTNKIYNSPVYIYNSKNESSITLKLKRGDIMARKKIETIEAANIYYFQYINAIGGIETFFYQLGLLYHNKDLVIVYRNGDMRQVERLSKYVKCIKFNNQTFKCKRAFFNFNTDIIDNVNADEYILVLHGDYKDMIERKQLNKSLLPIHKKINRYIGVSKLVCDTWKEITGIDAELCYNPMYIPEVNKKLNLISATRLSKEKGKERMKKLMNMLDVRNIPYHWDIFTNDKNVIVNPNITYHAPKLDILPEIKSADYLVQLSDNEGYCYSIIEALTQGVPVICTPCPVFEELGLKDGENCYFCDFEMKHVPIQKITKKHLKFKYTPPEDNWGNLLADGESSYYKDRHSMYLISATEDWGTLIDATNQKIRKPGEQWWVDFERLNQLIDNPFNKEVIKIEKQITEEEYSQLDI